MDAPCIIVLSRSKNAAAAWSAGGGCDFGPTGTGTGSRRIALLRGRTRDGTPLPPPADTGATHARVANAGNWAARPATRPGAGAVRTWRPSSPVPEVSWPAQGVSWPAQGTPPGPAPGRLPVAGPPVAYPASPGVRSPDGWRG